MKREAQLKRYAKMLVECGVNLKPGQLLVMRIPVEHAEFGRLLQKTAYESGAGEVQINWYDELAQRNSFVYASESVLKQVRESERLKLTEQHQEHAAYLTIISEDPDLMKGTDEAKNARVRKARSIAMRDLSGYQMKSEGQWCIAALPQLKWARKVFPKIKDEEEALNALYDAIFHTVYLDRAGDPVRSWKKHTAEIKEHCQRLNDYAFQALHFTNSIGTDLTVPLVKNHIWSGGSEVASLTGQEFNPNLPTEEIFTAPHRLKTEGTAVASRPLNLGGTLVEDFAFTFHRGKVIDYRAKKGKQALDTLLGSDNGAVRLGEVALVPFDSNISNLNLLFYETLFDENAACHLALGAAYPTSIQGGERMNDQQLREAGMNVSAIHVDFMFGTADLSADGICADGTRVPVFRDGNFVF